MNALQTAISEIGKFRRIGFKLEIELESENSKSTQKETVPVVLIPYAELVGILERLSEQERSESKSSNQ